MGAMAKAKAADDRMGQEDAVSIDLSMKVVKRQARLATYSLCLDIFFLVLLQCSGGFSYTRVSLPEHIRAALNDTITRNFGLVEETPGTLLFVVAR